MIVESGIKSNLVFCIIVGPMLFFAFCFLRRLFKGVYAPNVLNSKAYPRP